MNHDAKKSVRHFMETLSACIALVAAVMFFGCKQNMGNESKTPSQPKYTLTFSVDGGNGSLEAKVDGTKINSGDQVEKGKIVVFTAVPANAATHEVDAWTVSKGAFEQGTGGKGSTTASLKVTDAAAVTVKFKQKDIPPTAQYKVTLEKTLGGNVTVMPALPESGMVNKNTELTFTATKLGGYKFVKWERDGADTGVTEPTYKLTVTQPVRIKAVFEADGTPITKHTVTFNVDGGNGYLEAKVDGTKINSGDQVEKGKTVVFTAKPFSDYSVDTWSIDGSAFEGGSGAAGSQTARVTITADTTVTVKFKPTLTDQEKLEKAKEALKLYFQNGDTADSISSHWLNLPVSGLHDTKISWQSSDEAIIKIKQENEWNCYGSITRPEENTQVTLTATITRSAVSITKTFDVTVRGTNEDAVISAAEQAVRAIPSFVTKDTPIQLSPKETVSVSNGSSSSSVEVDIEWKAEPAGVISVSDGTVTPHETETQTVTLTATAKKGNAESSKTVTVTVYPKNNEPNLQAVVESIINGIPTEIDADIQLPQSPSGYELTWSSSNDSILKIAGNSGHIETWDLVDRTVTLTATLEKNAASKTATKKITIKARQKFGGGNNGDSYEFDGNKLTLRNGDGKPAAVYRVSIDTVAKTITATLERLTYRDNSLMEPEKVAKLVLAEKEIMPNLWFPILELQQKDLVTLKDIRAIHQQFLPQQEVGTEENIFSMLSTGMSYEEFLKKTPEEQSKLIKKALKTAQNELYKEMNLAETVPLTEAFVKMKEDLKKSVTAHLEKVKQVHIYQYRIEGDQLTFSGKHIPESWHEF